MDVHELIIHEKFRGGYTSDQDLPIICCRVCFHVRFTQAALPVPEHLQKIEELTVKFFIIIDFLKLLIADVFYMIMSKYSSLALKTLYSQCDLQPAFPACHLLLPNTNFMHWPKQFMYFSSNIPEVTSPLRNSIPPGKISSCNFSSSKACLLSLHNIISGHLTRVLFYLNSNFRNHTSSLIPFHIPGRPSA